MGGVDRNWFSPLSFPSFLILTSHLWQLTCRHESDDDILWPLLCFTHYFDTSCPDDVRLHANQPWTASTHLTLSHFLLVWILFADCSDRVINLKWFSQVLVWSFTFPFNFACLMQFWLVTGLLRANFVEYFNVNTIWRNSLEAAETFFFSLALCRCSFFDLCQYFYIYTQNFLAKQ